MVTYFNSIYEYFFYLGEVPVVGKWRIFEDDVFALHWRVVGRVHGRRETDAPVYVVPTMILQVLRGDDHSFVALVGLALIFNLIGLGSYLLGYLGGTMVALAMLSLASESLRFQLAGRFVEIDRGSQLQEVFVYFSAGHVEFLGRHTAVSFRFTGGGRC